MTTGIPSIEIQQQKEHVAALYFLMDQRQDELIVAQQNFDRAVKTWSEANNKLKDMKRDAET